MALASRARRGIREEFKPLRTRGGAKNAKGAERKFEEEPHAEARRRKERGDAQVSTA